MSGGVRHGHAGLRLIDAMHPASLRIDVVPGISQTPSEASESYETVAPFYDAVGQIYSGGAIGASREWVAGQGEFDAVVAFFF